MLLSCCLYIMNALDKYLKLFFLLVGGFLCFIIALTLIFFILKFTSFALLHIPGFEKIYGYLITIIPYAIFGAVFSFLSTRIIKVKNRFSKSFAFFFLFIGMLVCLGSFVMANICFFNPKVEWYYFFDDNSHYFLILQLLFVFLSSLSMALGSPKETDWMDKHKTKSHLY